MITIEAIWTLLSLQMEWTSVTALLGSITSLASLETLGDDQHGRQIKTVYRKQNFSKRSSRRHNHKATSISLILLSLKTLLLAVAIWISGIK